MATVAAHVTVELASPEIKRQVGHRFPCDHRRKQRQKYTYGQADAHTPRIPGQLSGQGQGLGEASPEPGLGAGVGVVADSDEPQDAGEFLLHCLVLDGDQSLLMSTWREAESKLSLEITFFAL